MASKLENSYEKTQGVTATTKPVEEDDPSTIEEQHPKPAHDITRATWTIVCGVALPCIPIIIITTILLYYIFKHQLVLSDGLPQLRTAAQDTHRDALKWIDLIRQQGGEDAYFVQYNASTITTIASWTGRVVPYLYSSIMALVAFYAARHIVLKSKSGDGSNLPTPEQLTILISVLGGSGFGPLKDALLYRYGRKEKLMAPLPAALGALFLLAFLGVLIPVVDSWFGIATKTVTVTQLYPSSQPSHSYGRGISATSCPAGPRDNHTEQTCLYNENAWWPCGIMGDPLCHGGIFVSSVNNATKITLGLSQTEQVRNYTDSTGKLYYYLGDPAQNAKIDYQAKTVALSSHCVPMTQRCYFNFDGAYGSAGSRFNCTSGFSGNLYDPTLNTSATDAPSGTNPVNVGIAFAANSELTQVGGREMGHTFDGYYNWTVPEIYPTNPLYYGVWAVGYPSIDLSANLNFTGDTGIYFDSGSSTGGIWMLNCSTTVHDVSYTWINGSINTFNHTLASADMGGLFSAPFALAPLSSYVQNALTSVANVAGLNNNSGAITTTFAEGFSQQLLAYSTGAMDPILNEYEQARNATVSVARIPMIPLYLLLATKFIYVLAVIILAIGAYCFTHPAETEIVKAQLSVHGLAAAHFQQPNLAQQNVVKALQERIDVAKSQAPPPSPPKEKIDASSPQQGIHRAETAPVHGSDKEEAPAKNARVGLLPGADGSWQFVVVANGVWNSIKPIVENLVVTDAAAGGLGAAGQVINAWK